jgi:hypothetical protein
MSFITDVLELFKGRLRFHLAVDGKPAADILVTPGEAIVEIKNPLLALELGVQQIGKKPGLRSYVLKAVKAAGYRVKIKYKMLEFEL